MALLFLLAAATVSIAQDKKTLKKVMELKIQGEGGANGAAVTYNPVTKFYYTAIAGNAEFPLEIFDATGKPVKGGQLKAGADLRGLWYNPATKTLEANTYNEGGWVKYELDSKGITKAPKELFSGMKQPDAQSLGGFEAKTGKVYFLYLSTVYQYDVKTGEEVKQVDIFPELEPEEAEELMLDYNETVVLPTGLRGKEFMLVNLAKQQLETFNLEGDLVGEISIPEEVVLYDIFNVSYANGIVWFFNKETRVWTGYK